MKESNEMEIARSVGEKLAVMKIEGITSQLWLILIF
jgi:hypothetical protein